MNDFDPVELMEQAANDTGAADLRDVKRLAARLVAIESDIAESEAHIAALKKEREEVRVYTLPGIMFELGIDSVTIE